MGNRASEKYRGTDDAWDDIVRLLGEIRPQWLDARGGTGGRKACQAIREIAAERDEAILRMQRLENELAPKTEKLKRDIKVQRYGRALTAALQICLELELERNHIEGELRSVKNK